jgi:membrane protease YdiL (CAAX protease family)
MQSFRNVTREWKPSTALTWVVLACFSVVFSVAWLLAPQRSDPPPSDSLLTAADIVAGTSFAVHYSGDWTRLARLRLPSYEAALRHAAEIADALVCAEQLETPRKEGAVFRTLVHAETKELLGEEYSSEACIDRELAEPKNHEVAFDELSLTWARGLATLYLSRYLELDAEAAARQAIVDDFAWRSRRVALGSAMSLFVLLVGVGAAAAALRLPPLHPGRPVDLPLNRALAVLARTLVLLVCCEVAIWVGAWIVPSIRTESLPSNASALATIGALLGAWFLIRRASLVRQGSARSYADGRRWEWWKAGLLWALTGMFLAELVSGAYRLTMSDDQLARGAVATAASVLEGGRGWLYWLDDVVTGPAFEEVCFRFLLFGGLRPKLGTAAAAMVSSACFAFWHVGYSASELMVVFWLGIVFALVYERSRSLAAPILCHGYVNAVADLPTVWFGAPA